MFIWKWVNNSSTLRTIGEMLKSCKEIHVVTAENKVILFDSMSQFEITLLELTNLIHVDD